MTHERARFLLTVAGAVLPLVGLGLTGILFTFAPIYAAIGAILIIISAMLIIAGQAGFLILACFWNCSQCSRQYFSFLMPFWPFNRKCQNCHLPD